MKRLRMLAWSLVLCACGARGDVRTEVLERDGDAFVLREVTLHGVRSLATLEGERVTFASGAELAITIDVSNGCKLSGVSCDGTVSELRDAIIKKTTPLRPRFQLSGGVYRPLDYDTLAATTLYHEITGAQDYFAALDVDPTPTAGAVPVYYYPDEASLTRFNLGTSDNAAYFQLVDGFLIMPHVQLQKVPFTVNRGVLFHEYFHRVFALRVFGERALRAFLAADESAFTAILRLRAANEGLADFFGAIGAGDPNFVGPSVSAQLADTRNISFHRTFQAEWRDAEEPATLGTYNPYPPGSCFANLLWRARDEVSEDEVVAAWFRADEALAVQVDTALADITFPSIVDAIVMGYAPADRPKVCAIARDIFAVLADELKACPP